MGVGGLQHSVCKMMQVTFFFFTPSQPVQLYRGELQTESSFSLQQWIQKKSSVL